MSRFYEDPGAWYFREDVKDLSLRNLHALKARGYDVRVREDSSPKWYRVYSCHGPEHMGLSISDSGRVRRAYGVVEACTVP